MSETSSDPIKKELSDLRATYNDLRSRGLALDLTRGKPAADQLSLSDGLDGILDGDYRAADGTDCRNYGGLDGLPETRKLGSWFLDCDPDDVMVGGNSSLTLMHQWVMLAMGDPLPGATMSWSAEAAAGSGSGTVRFLCPVPGYDRHFTICQQFGIEMIPVAMTDDGPDMDLIEEAVAADPMIKGIWCVPRYSNPTGVTYSRETVERFARLGSVAAPGFRIFWDNAYALHHLGDEIADMPSLLTLAREAGNEDTPLCFASTSKVTFAGSGVSFLAASAANRDALRKRMVAATIGPDKVNQLRHSRMFPNRLALAAHMEMHAELLAPKFAAVEEALVRDLGEGDFATWTQPSGGYFVSLDVAPGLAREVIRLAGEAGVKLTPAGATSPLGNDPDDTNIRVAPSFPPLEEVRSAMEVLTVCVRLATLDARVATADKG
ncbi:MAG: aspartate/methionine/tyrosine aminotransferase [Candidatus Binatia bacterium]|jgi:aspartate/methionine/tyrosine aminotransferase